MIDLDFTDVDALAAQALELADHDEHNRERAYSLLMNAAYFALNGFELPDVSDPNFVAGVAFAKRQGICPCSMVLQHYLPIVEHRYFGKSPALYSLVPVWKVASDIVADVSGQ